MSKFDRMTRSIKDSWLAQILLPKGFEIGTDCMGRYGEGFVNGFYSEDGLYYTHVFINEKLIYFYKEYECGGYISDWEYEFDDHLSIEEQIVDEFESFNFD